MHISSYFAFIHVLKKSNDRSYTSRNRKDNIREEINRMF